MVKSLLKKTKTTIDDYDYFVPELERLMQCHGKIRMLVKLIDFHGWTAGALWVDTKFSIKHFNDLEKLAIVGENKWEKGMAIFCKPFTTATVKYFDIHQLKEAEEWLKSNEIR